MVCICLSPDQFVQSKVESKGVPVVEVQASGESASAPIPATKVPCLHLNLVYLKSLWQVIWEKIYGAFSQQFLIAEGSWWRQQ